MNAGSSKFTGHPWTSSSNEPVSPWWVKRVTRCQFVSILQSLFLYLVIYLWMLSSPLGPWIYLLRCYLCMSRATSTLHPPMCQHVALLVAHSSSVIMTVTCISTQKHCGYFVLWKTKGTLNLCRPQLFLAHFNSTIAKLSVIYHVELM